MRARSSVCKTGVVVPGVGIGWNLSYEVTGHE